MFDDSYHCDEMECLALWRDQSNSNLSLNLLIIPPFQFSGRNRNRIFCFGRLLAAIKKNNSFKKQYLQSMAKEQIQMQVINQIYKYWNIPALNHCKISLLLSNYSSVL